MPTFEDVAQVLDVRLRDVNFLVRHGLFVSALAPTDDELQAVWKHRDTILGVLARRSHLGAKELSPIKGSWKPYRDGTEVVPVKDPEVARAGTLPAPASRTAPRGSKSPRARTSSRRSEPRDTTRRDARARERDAVKAAATRQDSLAQEVTVAVRERSSAPQRVVVHMGPTNSGKTYESLVRLAEAGSGTYAAPLRMLAMEAYEKLSALVGVDAVGLVTGEEQINPGAALICATAEMAPMRGRVLVVDEVQWVADRDRGWAWARLMAGAQYEEVHLCGAPEAEALARLAYADARVLDVVHHTRLEPLRYAGAVTLAEVPDNSVVVAFSRKAVLALARQLERQGRRAAVLYGALPPVARRAELERFTSGKAPVMVATDVIGHGVNMPAKAVVLAETSKYDGFSRRPLETWEAAQIVGRAGRHGLAGPGVVHHLVGVAGLELDTGLVKRAVEATTGQRPARPDLTHGELRPTLQDLSVVHPGDFPVALEVWHAKASAALRHHPWLKPLSTSTLLGRCEVLEECFGSAHLEWPLTAEDAWSLIRMPVDHTRQDSLFTLLVLAVAGDGRGLSAVLARDEQGVASASASELEGVASRARDLRAFATSFPGNTVVSAERARALEERAGLLLVKRMDKAVGTNSYGVCESCGKACAPWFSSCQSCHRGSSPQRWGRGQR